MLYKICKCSYTTCISIKKENNLLKKKKKRKGNNWGMEVLINWISSEIKCHS